MKKLLLIVLIIFANTTLHAQTCNAPVINSFSPNTGFIGSTVTIIGANFDVTPANNQVFFGATEATVISATFGQLVVTVPVGATLAPISIRNSCNKTAYSTVPFNGIFCPTPITATTYSSTAFTLNAKGAYNMIAMDMDLDGRPDVLSGGVSAGGVTIAHNQSTPGTLNFTRFDINTVGPQGIAVADFDGDGKMDIVLTRSGVYVHKNNSTPGSLSFGSLQTIHSNVGAYQVTVGDMNEDGKVDIITEGSGYVRVFLNTSTGTGSISFSGVQNYYVGHRCTGLQVADVDGDGMTDVLGSQGNGNRAVTLRNTTTPGSMSATFESAEYWPSNGTYPYRCMIADFDKDGKIDLTTCNYNGATNTAIFRNTSVVGNISFASAITLPSPTRNYRIGVGDANGDGYPDIVTKSLGVNVFSVYENTSTAPGAVSFAPRFDYTSSARAEVSGIVIADLDGDFVPDIATSGINSNQIRFHRNTSSQVDNINPTAICQNIIVALDPSGNASITASMVDNGSSDACGLDNISISQSSFTCADIGANNVTLTATDNAGNTATCTAVVTVAPAAVIISGQTTVCQGETIPMSANLGDSYQWLQNGVNISSATSQTYTATTSGAYSVQVTNNGGCSGTSSPVNVTVNNNPTVSTSPSGVAYLCGTSNTATITATQSAIYQWKLNGTDIAGATQQSLNASAAGSYSVEVIDLFGCSAVSSAIVVSATTAEIGITGNSLAIADGDNTPSVADGTDFGNVFPGTNYTNSFVINSTGGQALVVSSIAIGGVDASSYSISGISLPVTIASGSSASFNVVFNGAAIASYSGSISIISNDCDEVETDFTLASEITCVAATIATCASNVSVNSDANSCSSIAQYSVIGSGAPAPGLAYVFTGATTGSGSGTGTGSSFNLGVTNVTVTSSNACGSQSCSFTVSVIDNIAPNAVAQNVTVQLDASGNGVLTAAAVNNGSNDACGIASVAIDQTTFNCSQAVVESSIYFDGYADRVTVPVNSVLNFTQGTVEAWVKPGAAGNNRAVMSMRTAVSNTRWSIHLNESANSMGLWNGSAYTSFSYNFVPNNWYHVAVSFTATGTTFYINGAHAYTMTTQMNSGITNTPLTIGSTNDPQYVHEDFVGEMDEIRVWNTVRTQAQIVSSKDAKLVGNEIGLVTYLPFNENGGTSTSDHSNNGFTGTIAGAIWNTQNSPVNSSPLVTLTVTDNNGNSSTATATVTVEDNVAPAALTKNATVQLDASGNGSITTSDIDNGSNDACGIASLSLDNMLFTCANVGVNNPVTLTVTDNNGNVSTATATVTVIDNVAPVAVAQNVTVQLDVLGSVSITASQIDNGSNDLCGIASITCERSGSSGSGMMNVANGSLSGGQADIIEYSNSNAPNYVSTLGSTCGESWYPRGSLCDMSPYANNPDSSFRANTNAGATWRNLNPGSSYGILVVDLGSSQFVNAMSLFQMFSDGKATHVEAYAYNGSGVPTSSSTGWNQLFPFSYLGAGTNVNGVVSNPLKKSFQGTNARYIKLLVKNDGSLGNSSWIELRQFKLFGATVPCDFSCEDVGSNNVTLTVEDVNGNVSTASAIVTVIDGVAPVAVAQNVTVQLDASGNGSTTAALVNNGSSDACGIATMTINNASFTCANVGSNNPVTLTVTDVNGNVSTASAMVTVEDNVAPVAVAQNVTVELDASGNGSTTAALVNNGSSDACGIATMTINNASFTCANVGSNNPVTLTVTDVNGNVSTASAMVTVEDNVNPVAVAQNVTVQLDASGNGSTTVALVNNGSSDACGIATMTINNASFTCANVGSNNPVTLTVTDVNGNVSTASAMVTVEDNVNPVAVAQNVTVQLDASGNGSTTAALVNNGSSDACGIASMTINNASFTCANVGSNNPVMLTVTDNNGNVSTASAMVTVEDNVAPVAVAQNVTVQLDASGNGSTTAALVNNGSSDACGIASMTINNASFTCANVGSNNPVTLTVTDVNGNVSTASAIVTVEDNVNPVAVAQNVTVQLDASGNGSTTAAAVNNGSSDACGVASMTINNASFTCANVGSNNPVMLTVTDVNGNVSTSSAMVTVEDNVAPVAVAQNVTVQLDASGNGSTTAALVNNGSSDACGIASMTINNASFTCANVGSNNPVTLTVTDVNGNVSTASAMVTVEDNVAPVAVAQNVTVQLDASGNGSTTAALVNNGSSDACGIASMTINNASFTCANVGSNNPVTLTVTDVNGNVSTASAMVTVEDNVAPVAMCQAVSVTLANGMASVTPMDVDNGSNDACGIASMTLSEDTWTCGDIGNHTVTLTVTDNNGNVSSCNAVVTVIGEVPTCSIASIPTSSTYTGGVSTTLYIGYGAQSTTLSCTPTGGSSFTYAWTGSNLSSSTSSNPVFTPTSEGIYNFSVLVTNNNGCETTCSISICVRDIRVYSKKGKLQKNKVYLCHVPPGNNNNPQTLSVSVNAIASHLSNHSGDALGTCNSSCGTVGNSSKTGEMFTEEFEGQDVDVILYPNPSTDHFSVMVESEMEEMITIEVYDMAGNIVERTEGQFTYHEIEMGRNLASGIYMVVITQGNYRKVLRAVKGN